MRGLLLVLVGFASAAQAAEPRACVVVADRTGRAGGLDEAIATLATRQGVAAVAIPHVPDEDRTASASGCDQIVTVRVNPRVDQARDRVVTNKGARPGSGLLLAPEMGWSTDRTPLTNYREAPEDARNETPALQLYEVKGVAGQEHDTMVSGSVEIRAVGEERPWYVENFQLGAMNLSQRPDDRTLWRRTMGEVARQAVGVAGTALTIRR